MDTAQEILLVYREYTSRADSPDGRCSGFFFEQRHFTEKLVRPHCPQPEFLAVGFGDRFDFALLDDEHTVTDVPLANDYFPVPVLFSKPGHAFIFNVTGAFM